MKRVPIAPVCRLNPILVGRHGAVLPIISMAIFAVVVASSHFLQAADEPRPNIVLMMADDMGFSDIGCYGGEINTPNLNRMAAEGLRFTQFYNTARCCPTRATLISGLYAHQAGVGHMMGDYGVPGYRGDLNRECVTIAEVMKSAGYQTFMSGKWHVTPAPSTSKHNWPRQRGFEKFFGTIHGAGSFYDPVSLTRDNTPIAPEGDDFYYTDAIAENAATFIRGSKAKDAPFFIYVPFTAPHWPMHAPPEDIAKYKGRYDGGWDALRRERHRRMIDMGIVDSRWPLTERDPNAPAWEDVPGAERPWFARRMEVYAAMVDRLDQAVGTILESVRDIDAEENTLVLFLADNGGCAEELRPGSKAYHIPEKTLDGRPVQSGNLRTLMAGPDDTYQSYGLPWANASNTPFRLYKHWVHEGGISSPLVVYWPAGVKARGGLTSQPGHLIDLMATCVDVGGAEYPTVYQGHEITPLEGKSLAPLFAGGEREGHDAIFWEHEGNRAVRQGKWKLVSRYPGGWELYDIEADRTELNDLAPKYSARVERMAAVYERWAARANVVPWGELRGGR